MCTDESQNNSYKYVTNSFVWMLHELISNDHTDWIMVRMCESDPRNHLFLRHELISDNHTERVLVRMCVNESRIHSVMSHGLVHMNASRTHIWYPYRLDYGPYVWEWPADSIRHESRTHSYECITNSYVVTVRMRHELIHLCVVCESDPQTHSFQNHEQSWRIRSWCIHMDEFATHSHEWVRGSRMNESIPDNQMERVVVRMCVDESRIDLVTGHGLVHMNASRTHIWYPYRLDLGLYVWEWPTESFIPASRTHINTPWTETR